MPPEERRFTVTAVTVVVLDGEWQDSSHEGRQEQGGERAPRTIGAVGETVEFLTREWAQALEDAANQSPAFRDACRDVGLTIRQEILATEGSDDVVAAYTLGFHDGELSVTWDSDDDADVTFVQSRDAAEAIGRGDLNAQQAFVLGKLRVRGDLERLTSVREAFSQLEDVFADVRSRTRYDGP